MSDKMVTASAPCSEPGRMPTEAPGLPVLRPSSAKLPAPAAPACTGQGAQGGGAHSEPPLPFLGSGLNQGHTPQAYGGHRARGNPHPR